MKIKSSKTSRLIIALVSAVAIVFVPIPLVKWVVGSLPNGPILLQWIVSIACIGISVLIVMLLVLIVQSVTEWIIDG